MHHQNLGSNIAAVRDLVGTSFYHLGRFDSALEQLEEAIALYDPEEHRSLAFLYAEDPGVASLCWSSWTLFSLGFPDQACARSREALSRAEELQHRNTLAYAMVWDGVRSQLCRDCETAEREAEALVSLAAEQGFPLWLALGRILQGWTMTEAGRVEEGVGLLRKGLEAWRATGAEGWVPYFLALLADGYRKANQTTEGLNSLSEALLRVKESGARWIEAELHRLRGELLLTAPDDHREEAEACFHEAIEIARDQRAKSWELRAATSLSRLWRDQGKRTDAYNLLVPVYDRFTEGFETADVKNAKSLRDELR